MIRLQIHFEVEPDDQAAFEAAYADVYVPAMRPQPGYLGSTLLRSYPAAVLADLGADVTEFTYQLELDFDTEKNRLRWAASPEHDTAWTTATAFARSVRFVGYDVVDNDEERQRR